MGFIDVIKAKAKADKKTIVLPETEDIRTYEAAEAVLTKRDLISAVQQSLIRQQMREHLHTLQN